MSTEHESFRPTKVGHRNDEKTVAKDAKGGLSNNNPYESSRKRHHGQFHQTGSMKMGQ
jgi:hypothetical protein